MIDLVDQTPRLKVKFINNLSEIRGSNEVKSSSWTEDAPSKKKKMSFKGMEAF